MPFGQVFGRFKTTFTVHVPAAGSRDWDNAGRWVPGEAVTSSYEGIILPMSNDRLVYEEGGTYTNEDIRIYAEPPYTLEIGWRVEHNGRQYLVQEEKLYDQHGGYRVYLARRVGVTVPEEGEGE